MPKKKNHSKTNEPKDGIIISIAKSKVKIFDFLSPIGSVILRVWIALVFWKSGLTKLADWETTVFLFEEEYKTHEKLTLFGGQLFSPETAAFFGTSGELVLPILLIIGLWGRGAAFCLLLMTAVIEYTYQSYAQHITWAIVLGAILLQGPGRFSWDYFIKAKYFGFPKGDKENDKMFATFGTLAVTAYAGYLMFSDLI